MATATPSTVIGLFESRTAAEQAVNALTSSGISQQHISVIAGDHQTADIPNIAPVETTGSFDASTGAAVGGLAGFVGGILALAIPGIGPILAAGPLAAGIMGAGLGAATGGLIGGLREHGLPENDAAHVAEAIRHGRVLVAVHTTSDQARKASGILDDNGALDTEDLQMDASLTGAAPTHFSPLSAEDIKAARLRAGEGLRDRERARETRSQVYPGITGGGETPNS